LHGSHPVVAPAAVARAGCRSVDDQVRRRHIKDVCEKDVGEKDVCDGQQVVAARVASATLDLVDPAAAELCRPAQTGAPYAACR